ncbi:MAG: hemerythrin family protein [Melioribacteraceae bacterium]|nr:hemerythrin family protein [Melioribacteraceae bacterium]
MMKQTNFINFTVTGKLGIEDIDNQHYDLASLINRLYDNYINKDLESINQIFPKLIQHIQLHFEYEEKIMIENKFDGFYSHKMEHRRFNNNLKMIVGDFLESQKLFDVGVLESIRRWYYNHIEIKDRKLVEYIKSRENLNEKGAS